MFTIKNVLIVSLHAPFDNIAHAGGKTHNYYLKYLHSLSNYKVRLISFCEPKDVNNLDLDKYNIESDIVFIDRKVIDKINRYALNVESKLSIFNKNVNFVSNYHSYKVSQSLKNLKKLKYAPDLIILEWTQMVLLASMVKKIFPESKIIASEHDVTYLGFERKFKIEPNRLKKVFKKYNYLRIYDAELNALNYCDLIITHNNKDLELLADSGISREKLFSIVPYYTEAIPLIHNYQNKNIVFFGAMGRPENYLSAVWFIENVFWKIPDKDVILYIVGGNPHSSLLKFKSERIIITGFVDDVNLYFSNCLCSVAPLILGAGIKVKVLEAMAAGVVVLTNQIGIEGINAQKNKDYIHCEFAQDYIESITDLIANRNKVESISQNAKEFVGREFSLERSKIEYGKRLSQL